MSFLTNALGLEDTGPLSDISPSLVHQFNPAVLWAYYNLDKYKFNINKNFLSINRLQDHQIFLLNPEFNFREVPLKKGKATFYSRTPIPDVKNEEILEFVYNLNSLFASPSKQVRRGIRVVDRKEKDVVFEKNILETDLQYIYDNWENYKRSNPAVYQLIFEPTRYKRSFLLQEKLGWKLFKRLIRVKGKPYGAIVFAVQGDTAFEMAFLSLYFDKELKIFNDLNECIIIRSFYELYQEGVRTINPGFDGGMKGLRIFKEKIPFTMIPYYKYKYRP